MRAAIGATALLAGALAAQVPDPVAAHVSRGVAAREAGRLAEARAELESAVEAAPQLAEAHLYLGLVLHESGDFSAAADALERAIGLKPELPGARGLLGYDLLMLGRAGEAVAHLDAARRENPEDWRLRARLGRALLDSGNPETALLHLLDARAVAPSDPELLYLVSKAHLQLALQAQGELLSTAPESHFAQLAIAEDHDLNGRTDEAIRTYRTALSSGAPLPDAWRALGDLEKSKGRLRDALDAYRKALALNPEDATLHLRCGRALLDLGLAVEALPHLQAAVGTDSPSPEALEVLGMALADLQRYEEARHPLSRALAAADGDERRMKLHYQLARVSRKLGEVDAERSHLREFSTLRARLTSDEK